MWIISHQQWEKFSEANEVHLVEWANQKISSKNEIVFDKILRVINGWDLRMLSLEESNNGFLDAEFSSAEW